MQFTKIIKEKFQELEISETVLSATLLNELKNILNNVLNDEVKNVILSFTNLIEIEKNCSSDLLNIQRNFYSQGASFVVCNIPKPLLTQLLAEDEDEELNYTPTLSEAWDIVQMEEMEREMFGDEE